MLLQGEADVTVEHITRMNIQQFRHFISNAKVAGGGFGAEKADESFAAIAPLCRVSIWLSAWLCSSMSLTVRQACASGVFYKLRYTTDVYFKHHTSFSYLLRSLNTRSQHGVDTPAL